MSAPSISGPASADDTGAPYAPPVLSTLRDFPPSSPNPALISFSGAPSPSTLQYLSHSALRCRIASFSRFLIDTHSVPASAVVAIVIPNSPQFVVAFLGATAAGLVAAPLNAAYTAQEFEFFLSDAAVSTVVVRSDLAEDAPLRAAAEKLSLPVLPFPDVLVGPATAEEDAVAVDDDLCRYPLDENFVPKPESVGLFLHTSGTTSRPKGVPLTHSNLVVSLTNIANTYELTPDDRCLLVMPLFHVHGLMAATLTTLATGGAVIFPPGGKFSASAFWPSLVAGGATWYTAVPTIQQILLARAEKDYPKENPPQLRFIRSCSASLAAPVLLKMEEAFGASVLEAYAMTEAAHQMTSNPLPKHGVRKPGCVGLPQNVEVAILDEKNEAVAEGQIGEVCIRGENVTKGYQNNPEANEAAFAGGWFHTGDQGGLDKDGYLMLTGRIKELVNRGGEKISPLEVDAALLSHAGVKEAVAFAVPDEKYGEEVNAAVIWRENEGGTMEELRISMGKRIAAFKMPKRIFFVDNLPRTATGKIQRRIVAKHFLELLKKGEVAGAV